MTTKPIEVMLPYYGESALLERAVDSILRQTDQNWRLTIIDDNNPHRAAEALVTRIADPRFSYVRNDKQLGVVNFQKCVDLLQEEVCVLMGHDDRMLPGFIATVRQGFSEFPKAGIVQTTVQTVDITGRPLLRIGDLAKQRLYRPRGRTPNVQLSGEDLAISLLRGYWLYFPSIAWRSEPLARVGFRNDVGVMNDLRTVFDLVLSGESIVAVNTGQPLFEYTRHRTSMSYSLALKGELFAQEKWFFRTLEGELRVRGWSRAARVASHYLYSRLHAATLVPGAIMRGRLEPAGRLLRHAFT